jgi:hypothetical protein
MNGIRKRSCAIVSQAFAFGARCGIPMDALLDAQGTPAAAAGSMASLAPLLFTPGHAQPLVDVSEIPPDVCAAVGRTQATITEGWVLVRVYTHGVCRFFVSPALERDIATWEAVVKSFECDDPNEPEIELLIPRSECSKKKSAARVRRVKKQTKKTTAPAVAPTSTCPRLTFTRRTPRVQRR